jgi:hypothetical protein
LSNDISTRSPTRLRVRGGYLSSEGQTQLSFISRDGLVIRTSQKSDAVADAYSEILVGRSLDIPDGQREYFAWHHVNRFIS